MSHFPNHPPSVFLATAAEERGDRMKQATPGLGGVTEVYYEWWNVDLLKTLYHQLGKEERAAVKQVKQEAVPWKDPATGERRSKPTAAEKLVQKKRERRERIRLMAARFFADEPDAADVRMQPNGEPVPIGPRRFHFKGKMRCIRIEYARMKKSGIGRRYPRNMPAIWREGDEFMGEQDRLPGTACPET